MDFTWHHFIFFETGSCYVAQALICDPPASAFKYWDDRHVSPHVASIPSSEHLPQSWFSHPRPFSFLPLGRDPLQNQKNLLARSLARVQHSLSKCLSPQACPSIHPSRAGCGHSGQCSPTPHGDTCHCPLPQWHCPSAWKCQSPALTRETKALNIRAGTQLLSEASLALLPAAPQPGAQQRK